MSELVEVHLLELPVDVWARAQEQLEALQREFALATADPRSVPARLLQLVQALQAQFGALSSPQEEQLLDAVDAGTPVLADLVYRLPASVGPAAQALGGLLDEADEHCRTGDALLTLAADEDLVRFRWWFFDELTHQSEGRAPVPWPQYARD